LATSNSFQSKTTLDVNGIKSQFYSLRILREKSFASIARLPYSLKILLENLLRHEDGRLVSRADIEALAQWAPGQPSREIAFMPARVILQDFTGVPCAVDLASMRDSLVSLGGDPKKINPLKPVDLVIDHSVQVDFFGQSSSFDSNVQKEFERNKERYEFLRWAQNVLRGFRVVPPGTGIVHQVNLEYLANVVFSEQGASPLIYPDSLLGTDSHTTMINGLGVLGWGVGGIEAEAAMLGQPVSMLIPEVVGMKLTGTLPEGATATDLVLTVTQILRKAGVVGQFVEFYGAGLSSLGLADRATVANMAPEYGATMGFFPVDAVTLDYLRQTGREEQTIQTVEAYCKEQGLFRTDNTPDPVFSRTLELNLKDIEPSLAGPKRPQDRVALGQVKTSFNLALPGLMAGGKKGAPAPILAGHAATAVAAPASELSHGSVVVAAITSCTNTSNPAVMLQAGLLAKKALERGLQSKPWVKTSLAPGSRVVIDYLKAAGLLEPLEKLGFFLVGYGCTTCIGNSGPLPESVEKSVKEGGLVVASVLSGNRNFEGRIQPLIKANYLASPPLVVAYAIAGHMGVDLVHEPMGHDRQGKPVFLKDIWPSQQEVRDAGRFVSRELFRSRYAHVFEGDKSWNLIPLSGGDRFEWKGSSTYIRKAPFFDGMTRTPAPLKSIRKARALALLGDFITTDHISPAGSISADSPAGRYLVKHGVSPKDFNSYGARRGNHEVMVRGTLANIRLKNELAPGTEGGWTRHMPDGAVKTIYDASTLYGQEGVPLVILAGKEYGAGSSRDWAAKGVQLLGVKVVIAESYERIHRSNLVGMGVLPLEFSPGENWKSLGLTGEESYDIADLGESFKSGQKVAVQATTPSGTREFEAVVRIDTPGEWDYYRHGGILLFVLRQLLEA